jgi:hypothetical protein
MVAVRNFFVWMLIAWVASGPSALAWHHALEHSGLNNHVHGCCSTAELSCPEAGNPQSLCGFVTAVGDSSKSCNSTTKTVCPFGFHDSDSTATDSPRSDDSSPGSAVYSGVMDECRTCEILLHSDAAVYANELKVSCDTVHSTCDEFAVSRPFERWFGTWSVRGPPSC